MSSNPDAGNKASLRKALRQARRSLSIEQQQQAAKGLLAQLQSLPAFPNYNKVALYLANDGEIDPREVMDWLQNNGKQSYVPMVQQQDGRNWLMFAEVKADTEFVNNHFGIAEPKVDVSEWISAAELDLVLLPLVGFDGRGNRIGMGGGFYDTTFEFVKDASAADPLAPLPTLVGIAHEVQKVDTIDAESWDIPLSVVVTDQNLYRLMS